MAKTDGGRESRSIVPKQDQVDRLLDLQEKEVETQQLRYRLQLEEIKTHAKHGETWAKRDIAVTESNNKTGFKKFLTVAIILGLVLVLILGLIILMVWKGEYELGANLIEKLIIFGFGALAGFGGDKLINKFGGK
ncbi:MAG: hypothetical protein ACOCZ8_01705 [Bacteroidota bacterium]